MAYIKDKEQLKAKYPDVAEAREEYEQAQQVLREKLNTSNKSDMTRREKWELLKAACKPGVAFKKELEESRKMVGDQKVNEFKELVGMA